MVLTRPEWISSNEEISELVTISIISVSADVLLPGWLCSCWMAAISLFSTDSAGCVRPCSSKPKCSRSRRCACSLIHRRRASRWRDALQLACDCCERTALGGQYPLLAPAPPTLLPLLSFISCVGVELELHRPHRTGFKLARKLEPLLPPPLLLLPPAPPPLPLEEEPPPW